MTTVLLVDNAPWLRDSLARLFRDCGHVVLEAATEADALAHDLQNCGAVICDWDLGPDQPTGADLIARIRERHPGIPHLVILSGLARDVDAGTTFILKDGAGLGRLLRLLGDA